MPHHITSSPFVADAYARVVFGFLRDCHAAKGDAVILRTARPRPAGLHSQRRAGPGAGPLRVPLPEKVSADSCAASALDGFALRYVMTDFAERNLEYWRAHPWLRPFVEDGSLDFASLRRRARCMS